MFDIKKIVRFIKEKTNKPNALAKGLQTSRTDSQVIDESCKALTVQDGGLGLFRLIHLLDAIERLPCPPKRIISVGSGKGYHEIILSKLFPEASVLAIDIEKQEHAFQSANLKLAQGDITEKEFSTTIEPADFLYSIECLEHIEKDEVAFAAMVNLTSPGGFFYIQIPFANSVERADEALCAEERKNFGHCTPGYDADQLAQFSIKNNITPVKCASVFWSPLQPMLWAAVERFNFASMPDWDDELIKLLTTDLRDEVAQHRAQAIGIKLLAQKNQLP